MDKFRLISVFVVLAMVFSFANVSPASAVVGSPVAQWVADDWTGGTDDWVDRIGGRVATISTLANSPTKTVGAIVNSQTASGIVFDGVNDFFAVAPDQNPIQGATSVTIVAFFNTTQGASGADGNFWRYPGPINGEAPGVPNDWGLTYNAAGEAQGFFNNQINPSPAVSLIDGQPHTMILTWQMSEKVARLYVDGALVGSTNTVWDFSPGVNNTNGLVFGAEMEGAILGFFSPRFFSGAIGELRFYNSIEDPGALHAEILGNQPNQPPTAVANGPYLAAVGHDVTLDGSGSSDPDGDDLSETWTADGGTVVGNVYTAGAEAGIYDVCLTVNDGTVDSDPDCTMVVVYDPSGGFVTGGGWIDSPAGAYKADETLSGKATFGFVSKYKKGATVPTGNTEFQFKSGDLNFHSTSYEWLVVAGNTAQFKGEGTINGQGNYRFMIWADDDNPDTFRIQISGDNGVVYDNGSQQSLGGGNIKVHQ